jgi:hypothetical protein
MEVVGDTSNLPLREKLFLQLYRLYYITFYQLRTQCAILPMTTTTTTATSNLNSSSNTTSDAASMSFARAVVDPSLECALARGRFVEYKRQSISLLLDARQYGYALDLAETFEDYEALIYICEVWN